MECNEFGRLMRGTEGFADFIICQNGEVLETIGDYCKRMNIEIK